MTTADNGAGAAGNSAAAFFEAWQDMFRKQSEAWSQAVSNLGGFAPPNPGAAPFGGVPFASFPFGFAPGGGTPGSNPFSAPFNPADFMQQWQRMFETWQAQWGSRQDAGSGAISIEEAQRQWSRYLESMATTFAETMSTEEFAKALGKYMEQSLAWQERMAKQVNPQLDAMLRWYNLPSRSQLDRLFARVIGIEEKLDDLEDELRKFRAEMREASRADGGIVAEPTH